MSAKKIVITVSFRYIAMSVLSQGLQLSFWRKAFWMHPFLEDPNKDNNEKNYNKPSCFYEYSHWLHG